VSERARLGWPLVLFEVAPPWSVTSVSCELARRVGGAFAVVGPADEIGDALSCGCLHPGHDMGVHVQRHRRVRVPETLRHHIDRHATRQRDRRVGMSQVMKPDPRQPNMSADPQVPFRQIVRPHPHEMWFEKHKPVRVSQPQPRCCRGLTLTVLNDPASRVTVDIDKATGAALG